MTGISSEARLAYLRSVCDRCEKWWQPYAFIDEIDEKTWFEFGLKVKISAQLPQTQDKSEAKKETICPILEVLDQYVDQKWLISGIPGAGKSTLMARIFLKFAHRAQEDLLARIPVLLELKSYYPSDGIWTLIQASLEEYDLYLELSEIRKLVEEKQLILLIDGLNELSEETSRSQLEKFCRRSIPLIAATRELNRDLSIDLKLEIQPLSVAEVETFLLRRLPNYGRAQVKELCDRVQDFGQTPLMVWMLYSVFSQKGDIPQTRGAAYRAFTTLYAERAKSGIDLNESRFLLSKLAFAMMQSQKSTEFRLEMTEVEAQNLLGSKKECDRLLNNHLLQWNGKPGNRRIRFCHQSLQEYYAAEMLLMMLQEQHPDVVEHERFQHFYLNYLKWTEAIAILLGFPEIKQNQGKRIVELALDVDLMLGARLAGEVQQEIQHHTVESAKQKLSGIVPEEPVWLKLRLMETIGSTVVVGHLIPLLDHPNRCIRYDAYITLLELAPERIPETCRIRGDARRIQHLLDAPEISETQKAPEIELQVLEYLVPSIRSIFDTWISGTISSEEAIVKLAPLLQNLDSEIRWSAVKVIGSIKSELSLTLLLQAIEDPDSSVRHCAAVALGKLGFKSVIPKLAQIIEQHPNVNVRYCAVHALRIIGSKETIPSILQAMQDAEVLVCCEAVEASGRFRSKEIVPGLLAVISHPDAHTRRLAAYNLRSLSVVENIVELLNEQHLETLIQALDHADNWVRWRIVFTLWNAASEKVIPLLHSKLNHQNRSIAWGAALVLGKFGCKEAVSGLIQLMDYSNLTQCPDIYEIFNTASYALGQIEGNVAAEHLSKLISFLPTQSGQDAFRAIASIQNRCQFYNYEIFQKQLPLLSINPYNRIQPGVTVNNTFNIGNLDAGSGSVNLGGTITGDQVGTQNNYASDPKIIKALAKILEEIQQKHSQPSSQTPDIIDVEFEEIKRDQPQRWQTIMDLLSVTFAGGVEAIKIVAPQLGIPIEVVKRLYEIYDRNRKSLPAP